MEPLRVTECGYLGWKRCLSLESAGLKMVVTLEVGPRIIHFGPKNGENLLYVFKNEAGKSGGPRWRSYGGHRLWYAPEKTPYPPDNGPVNYSPIQRGIRLTQAPERNGIQKQLEISVLPGKPGFRILHRLINRGRASKKIAPWALTVLKAGGEAIVPLPPRAAFPKKLLPSGPLQLWPYSDLSDPRYRLGFRQLRFHADPRKKSPQKFGLWTPQGWAAYALGSRVFIKEFGAQAGAPYPDGGVNTEIFAMGPMIELESLGPLKTLKKGDQVEHLEHWRLGSSIPQS